MDIVDPDISDSELFSKINEHEIGEWYKYYLERGITYFLRYDNYHAIIINFPNKDDYPYIHLYKGTLWGDDVSINGPWVFENSRLIPGTDFQRKEILAEIIRKTIGMFSKLDDSVKESIKEALDLADSY
ncbi:MAG: hypothetical protein Q7S27_00105 [Nanoarchaeota archaeon]|nr:hypothetical protein [Nanoarchaeota archaeon]